jgi:hypothetical protein
MVQEIIDLQGEKTTIPYIRKDRVNKEFSKGQLRLAPWDRRLPAWFTTPETWVEPSTPPGLGKTIRDIGYHELAYIWRKVPTLALPGLGHTIIPTAKQPSLVASHLYLVVSPTPEGDQCITLEAESPGIDRVFNADKRDPTSYTADDVRGQLLGRWIQTSTASNLTPAEEGVNVERPSKRARLRTPEQFIGIVWGYEDSTRRLYCVTPINKEFIVDLSTKASDSRLAITSGLTTTNAGPRVVRCEWIGPVSLGIDAVDVHGNESFGIGVRYGRWAHGYSEQVKAILSV